MKKFWNWKNRTVTNVETQEQTQERTLFLNGTIAGESWFDDDVTPQLFKDELMSGSGNITVWINSPAVSMLYSKANVVNSLMEKIAAKCAIDPKSNRTQKADDLMDRLNLIKNWR